MENCCAMSWSGYNVYGDSHSIKAVKQAVHEAGTVPELKDTLRAYLTTIASLEADNIKLLEASINQHNKIAILQHSLDSATDAAMLVSAQQGHTQ